LIAALLQVENDKKQALLEIDDAEARLAQSLVWLREENKGIARFLAESREVGDTYFRGRRISLN
jgi:hypothetical protein